MRYKIQSLDAARSKEWKTLCIIENEKRIDKVFASIKEAANYLYYRCDVPNNGDIIVDAEYWANYPKNTQFRIIECR